MRHLLILLSILSSFTAFSQTVVAYREATLNDSQSYTLDGTAFIEELSDGTFRFRLSSDYVTQSGPDVQIFMTNDNNFVSPIDITSALFVEDVGTQPGGINHFSGSYSKILSGITSLSSFDHVVFVCVGFGFLHWGNGTFGGTVIPCTPTLSSITETVCDSYTSPSGQIHTASGIFTDTIPNIAGCDSIIIINLTVNTVDVTTTMIDSVVTSAAAGASYQWINCSNMNTLINGETNQSFTISNTDSYAVIINQMGCVDTSNCVTYCLPTSSTISETVCDSYTSPSGQTYTSSGTFVDTIPNFVGCDSIITINLTVNIVDVTTTMMDSIVTSVATGASYQWINCSNMNAVINGETNQSFTISNSDSYAVIINQMGCVDTSNCVNYCIPTSSTISETVCDSYTSPSGQVYYSSGVITDLIPNSAGCDSTITINLTVNTVDTTLTMTDSIVTSVATGASYQWINCSNLNTLVNGETNQSFIISDTDSYAVIINQAGCTDTSHCVNYIPTNIENNDFGRDITIRPNPINNNATIDLGNISNAEITVIDINGKIVNREVVSDKNQLQLNVSLLDQGVYFLQVKNNDGQSILKFIKQ